MKKTQKLMMDIEKQKELQLLQEEVIMFHNDKI